MLSAFLFLVLFTIVELAGKTFPCDRLGHQEYRHYLRYAGGIQDHSVWLVMLSVSRCYSLLSLPVQPPARFKLAVACSYRCICPTFQKSFVLITFSLSFFFPEFVMFQEMALAALFLAAKIEEQPRPIEHFVRVFHGILYKSDVSKESGVSDVELILLYAYQCILW